MNNAENGIDGVRVGRLTNLPAAGDRIPSGNEIASVKMPESSLQTDLQVVLCGHFVGRLAEFHMETAVWSWRRSQKSCIPSRKHVAEVFVATADLYRDSSNFDYDAVVGLNLDLTSDEIRASRAR